jgi:hypothetical protein
MLGMHPTLWTSIKLALSICMHKTTWELQDRFSWNLILQILQGTVKPSESSFRSGSFNNHFIWRLTFVSMHDSLNIYHRKEYLKYKLSRKMKYIIFNALHTLPSLCIQQSPWSHYHTRNLEYLCFYYSYVFPSSFAWIIANVPKWKLEVQCKWDWRTCEDKWLLPYRRKLNSVEPVWAQVNL